MKTLKKIGTAGIIALMMSVIFSANLSAKGTPCETGDCCKEDKVENALSKEIEKLIAEIQVDEEAALFDGVLKEEGLLDCGDDMNVTILNEAGEVVYEGVQSGITITDKTLKNYVEKADFLVNVDNIAYYMIF